MVLAEDSSEESSEHIESCNNDKVDSVDNESEFEVDNQKTICL